MNLYIIAGRLGQDPQHRVTTNGKDVLNFSIATDEWDGQKTVTEWHNVVVWGKRAASLSKLLAKGSYVLVHGSKRTRKWTAQDGAERTTVECVTFDVELGPKTQGAGQNAPPRQASRPVEQRRPPQRPAAPRWDDQAPEQFDPPGDDDPFAQYGGGQ